MRGRTIWGGLVKYDEPWRAGANAATKITFSKDVTIDKKAVPAGSYMPMRRYAKFVLEKGLASAKDLLELLPPAATVSAI